jgi:hypothetical protein
MIRLKPLLPAFALALVMTGSQPALAETKPFDPSSLMTKADTDADGAISKAEFLAARAASFPQLDRNGDGSLTTDEFKAAAPKGARRMMVSTMVAQFDTDGNGKISEAEYNAGPTLAFDRADANKDGQLSGAELEKARKK